MVGWARRWLATGAGLAGLACACSGSPSAPAAPPPGTTPGTEATTTTTEVPDEGGRVVDAYTPAVGDCFDTRTRSNEQGGETTYHLVVDCSLPHTAEVYALVTVAGDAYPGGDALRRTARLECPRRFADYVGARYELSAYGLGYELPTADRWAVTPTIGCTATGPGGGRTSGSARGSGR